MSVESQHGRRLVALLTPYDGGNLGDAAIQEALLTNLRKCDPEIAIWGITLDPARTSAEHHIPCYPLAGISRPHYRVVLNSGAKAFDQASSQTLGHSENKGGFLRRLLRWPKILLDEATHLVHSYRLLRKIDLLIIAGGGQLDDEWGGSWGHPYALAKWSKLARIAGSEVVFLSVGACRTDSGLTRFFLSTALSGASYRSYRDSQSRRLALAITPRAEGPVAPDLAFSLPTPGSEAGAREQDAAVRVGLSPIAYCHPRLWPTKDQAQYERYMAELARFASRILQEGASISLFASSPPDDQVFFDLEQRLDANLSPAARMRLSRKRVNTLADLLGVLQSVDLVVASRLHGLMLSFLCSKPAVAVSYDRKVTSLMEEMNLSAYCLDIQSFESELLLKSFSTLRSNREIIVPALTESCRRYNAALQKQFCEVAELLTERCAGHLHNHAQALPQRNP